MESNYNKKLGITLIIVASLFTAVGQLFWKLSEASFNLNLIIGFFLYGLGAVFMIAAFKFERVSLSLGYVISIALGFFLLNETISPMKLVGTLIIIVGVILVGGQDE